MAATTASVVVVGILLGPNQMWDFLPFGMGDLVDMNKLHLRCWLISDKVGGQVCTNNSIQEFCASNNSS